MQAHLNSPLSNLSRLLLSVRPVQWGSDGSEAANMLAHALKEVYLVDLQKPHSILIADLRMFSRSDGAKGNFQGRCRCCDVISFKYLLRHNTCPQNLRIHNQISQPSVVG